MRHACLNAGRSLLAMSAHEKFLAVFVKDPQLLNEKLFFKTCTSLPLPLSSPLLFSKTCLSLLVFSPLSFSLSSLAPSHSDHFAFPSSQMHLFPM